MISCYQCGKREAKIEGLCEPCFLERQPPLIIKDLHVLECRECGRFYVNSWVDSSLEEVLRAYVKVPDADITVTARDSMCPVSVVARQVFHKDQTHPLVQQTQFFVYVGASLCSQCSKMLSGYYEAVLQVRRSRHVLTPEEREECHAVVTDSLERKEFVSRIEEKKEGTDFYFSSTKAARRAADLLKKRFGGTIRGSYRLAGYDRQTSTDIKRGTILFSAHPYKKGEIISLKGSLYEVESSHHTLHIRNAEEKKGIPWKKVEYLENEGVLSLLPPSAFEEVMGQVLDVTPTSLLVMCPDFTTLYLERPKSIKVEIGKSYQILFFQGRAHWM